MTRARVDLDDLLVRSTGVPAEQLERGPFVDPVPLHQDPLGPLGHRATSERLPERKDVLSSLRGEPSEPGPPSSTQASGHLDLIGRATDPNMEALVTDAKMRPAANPRG